MHVPDSVLPIVRRRLPGEGDEPQALSAIIEENWLQLVPALDLEAGQFESFAGLKHSGGRSPDVQTSLRLIRQRMRRLALRSHSRTSVLHGSPR